MNHIPLSRKLFIWLLLTAMVPSVLIASLYLSSFKNAFLEQEKERLSYMADDKVKQLEAYIAERLADSRLLSQSLETSNALKKLAPVHREKGRGSKTFIELEESLHDHFNNFKDNGYYDIYLISPDGEIVLTLTHEDDFGSNIFSGKYKGTDLSLVVETAKSKLKANSSTFNYYAPSKQAAAFFAAPVLESGSLLGIVALQINTDIIQKITFEKGSMKSREILVGTKRGDGFSYQVPLKFDANIIVGKELPNAKLANPLFNAMEGTKRIAVDRDYRNVEVIAASRYIPSMNWGLVLKEDLNEAMQVVDDMIQLSIAILLLVFLSVITLASYLGRSLAKPIVSITNVSQAIADGNINLTVKPEGYKESFELANSFNKMSSHLKDATILLEQKVEERTREFKEISTRLQKISARLPGMVYQYELSPDGSSHFPYASDAINEIYRVSPEKALEDAGKVFAVLHPDDLDRISRSIEESARTLQPWQLEYRVRFEDGTVRWLYGNSIPERTNDGGTLWHGFITDITERKQAEQKLKDHEKKLSDAQKRYQTLFDKSADAFLIIEGRFFTDCNQATIDMLGYESREEILALHPSELSPKYQADGQLSETKANHMMNLAFEKNSYRFEWNHKRKNGEVFPVEVLLTAMTFEDKQLLHVVWRDITERKLQEEQLRSTQKMDALGKLTGGIAHDYNNMLGVVLGYSDLLEASLNDQPKLASYVKEIHHAGQRGAQLTKKLLDFSRTKGTYATKLDINSLLLSNQHMLEKTLTPRIKLKLELVDEPWSVWLDNADLEDAILNMSINAMHAIEKNGQLTIKTSNVSIHSLLASQLQIKTGDYILLDIIDTGCGMDKETQQKIFDPFFSTKGDKGTGLGLSQVYGFVERSSGTIKTQSKPGTGTQFSLYFPRYTGNDSESSDVTRKYSVDLKGNKTILIVDDEPSLLGLCSEILNKQGYKTFCAQSAKGALDILEYENVDLLFSDIIMPEMDGYELASIVQKQYPDVKIQLTSGFSDVQNQNKIDATLSENILNKPYTSQSLLKCVQSIFE